MQHVAGAFHNEKKTYLSQALRDVDSDTTAPTNTPVLLLQNLFMLYKEKDTIPNPFRPRDAYDMPLYVLHGTYQRWDSMNARAGGGNWGNGVYASLPLNAVFTSTELNEVQMLDHSCLGGAATMGANYNFLESHDWHIDANTRRGSRVHVLKVTNPPECYGQGVGHATEVCREGSGV